MKKEIARTLSGILDNPIVAASLDRSIPIRDITARALKDWEVDLNKRNPLATYVSGEDGIPVYRPTDFDEFSLLRILAKRRAVINIPKYERIGPRALRRDQRVVSGNNRHGELFKVVSHNDAHSFSVRIKDYNVIQFKSGKEVVGAPRHFMVVDYNGRWCPGWGELEFKPTDEELDFFKEHGIIFEPGVQVPMLVDGNIESVEGGRIRLEHFVHPNLARAFYGSRYIAMKALVARIKDQAKAYHKRAEELMEDGVRLPRRFREPVQHVIYDQSDTVESLKIQGIETKLILPDMKGEYPIFSLDEHENVTRYEKMPVHDTVAMQGVLRYSLKISKRLTFSVGTAVRTPVRAVELAFLHGFRKGDVEYGNEILPGWGIPEWIRDYREFHKRTRWNALELAEGAMLMYRLREKTVNAKPGPSYIYEESVTRLVA